MLYFLLFLSAKTLWAQNTSCSLPMSFDQFMQVFTQTRENYYPELKSIKINVTTFTSDSYFLQAQPSLSTLFENKKFRSYEVQLNLKLLDCPPSQEALVAILVHELSHVRDYQNWTSSEVIIFAMKYQLNFQNKVAYERATDLKVLGKNLHLGLIAYRQWVYQWLTPKELALKRKIYLTPEEITNLIHQ